MFKESLPAGVELGQWPVPSCLFGDFLIIRFTEKASIDECFIDFTRPVREELLRRFPRLAQVPTSGTDTPLPPPSTPIIWNAGTNPIPIDPKDDVTDNLGKPGASTQGDPELEEPPITWHDIALSIAAEMMQGARDQVRTKLGYSTSAVCASLPTIPLYRFPHAINTRVLQGINFLPRYDSRLTDLCQVDPNTSQLTASYRKPNSQVCSLPSGEPFQ